MPLQLVTLLGCLDIDDLILNLFGMVLGYFFFIIFKKTRKMGLTMGIALLLGFLTGNVFLKNVVARIRPYDLNESVTLLVSRLSDYSIPSGHTLASFEAATAMTLYNKRLGIPALVLATLIALSRLYLYVHYPTDVLAGAALGITFAFLAFFIVKKAEEKLKKNAA